MANIKAEPGEVISCGNNIISTAQTYNTEVKNIYSIVDDLKTVWTGSSASRYTDNIESFRADYEKFGTLINDLGELVTAIGKDYQSLEDNL